MAKRKKVLKCSICGDIIKPNWIGWEYGNNAQPINNGRCCDDCNYAHVIPARYGIDTLNDKCNGI